MIQKNNLCWRWSYEHKVAEALMKEGLEFEYVHVRWQFTTAFYDYFVTFCKDIPE